MLAVVCWLWRGWRPVYTCEHVNTLARMLRARLSLPHRLMCVTDIPAGITECETVPLWDMPVVLSAKPQNCFARLRLFDEETARRFGECIVSIDLDSVILRDLAPLITSHTFRALRGKSAPINGSMFMLRAGAHPNVWHTFDPQTSPAMIALAKHNGKHITGSDQAWMSLQIPSPATWGPEDGVLQFSELRHARELNGARAVFFSGSAKPWTHECKERFPLLFEAYAQWSR